MSEAIDTDSNNLCTTEDAFEKFQAVSMCEEVVNEFITLSDIVSPPPPKPNLSEILHKMPSDDVSSLLVEDTLNQVTSTTDQIAEDTIPKQRGRKNKSSLGNSEYHVSGGIYTKEYNKSAAEIEIIKNNVTSQGLELRKLKSNLDNKYNEDKSPNDSNHIPLRGPPKSSKSGVGRYKMSRQRKEVNETTSTPPVQHKLTKRRGRKAKPRNIKLSTPAPSISTTNNDPISDNMNKLSNNKEVLGDTQSFTARRGRRKKKIPSELIEYSNEVVLEPNTNVPLVENSLSSQTVIRKKRGRKPKINNSIDTTLLIQQQVSHDAEQRVTNDTKQQVTNDAEQKCESGSLLPKELTDDEMEDMPLVALSNKNNKDDKNDTINIQFMSENPLSTDTTQPISITGNTVQKKAKRRGRPRKVNLDNSTQINFSGDENDIATTNVKVNTDKVDVENSNEVISQLEISKNNSENIENKIINDSAAVQGPQDSIPNDSSNKRNSKKPIMSDFEYNIDSIVKNGQIDDGSENLSDYSESEMRDTSKRPVRRKAKKNLHYDEGSDEDPYANVELSDDEPRRRKGRRYNSDDEYLPGGKRQLLEISDSDIELELDEELDDFIGESSKQKFRKNLTRSEFVKNPKKRAKKGELDKANDADIITQKSNTDGDGDLEDLLQTSVIKTSDDVPPAWGSATKEFKDFLSKISQGTDIKIKKAKSKDNTKSPLQIPVLDPNEAKKTIEICTQTDRIRKNAVAVQTSNSHEVPMKDHVPLSAELSEKACEFLSGIVKTTAELGQLMTQKSEDFIEKKINTTYVTDTLKMDYCVKKSFLLFRLAKHNLVQMEEDLAKQYEDFLKEHNLIQHREEQKIIESTSKVANNDSDCEIIEEPVVNRKEIKPAFNPKTVFLNKELSIKIAKKTAEEPKPKKKTNVYGVKQTVWINDSIMVKKVKPTQSFLAQDSRNKKPPDTKVLLKMVSDFFKTYNHLKATATCKQLVRPQWFNVKQSYTCCYFFDKSCESSESSIVSDEEVTTDVTPTENNLQKLNNMKLLNDIICPNSLLSLCTEVIQRLMLVEDPVINNTIDVAENVKSQYNTHNYESTRTETKIAKHLHNLNKNSICVLHKKNHFVSVGLLKTLCLKKVTQLIHVPDFSECLNSNIKNSFYEINEDMCMVYPECSTDKIKPLFALCLKIIQDSQEEHQADPEYTPVTEKIKPLFSLCFKVIQECQEAHQTSKSIVERNRTFHPDSLKSLVFNKVKNIAYKNNNVVVEKKKNIEPDALKTKAFNEIRYIFCTRFFSMNIHENERNMNNTVVKVVPTNLKQNNSYLLDCLKQNSPLTLKSLCFNFIQIKINDADKKYNIQSNESLNFTIGHVNTVAEDVFLNSNENYDEHNNTESAYLDEEHYYSDEYETNYDNNVQDDDNWVSQVQMKELRSFIEPLNNDRDESPQHSDLPPNGIVNIKLEPIEELSEDIVEANVKTEPIHEEDTILMPLVSITKQENLDVTSSKEPFQINLERQNSNSYDENSFEAFVSGNKMIISQNKYESTNEEIYTQSTSRVRRQHEPDSDGEIDDFADSLNLLVPQNAEMAKDRLMESSSEDESNKKKKPEKRGRGRRRKSTKIINTPTIKENITSKTALAIITRRMREKIRQVEKRIESSESESEDAALCVIKAKRKMKNKENKKQLLHNKDIDQEIQCNDVDSTEKINENKTQRNGNIKEIQTKANDKIQAFVNYGSKDPALSNDNEQNQYNDEDSEIADTDDKSNSPLINACEPVELLECEPIVPMFDNIVGKSQTKRKSKGKTVTAAIPLATGKVDTLPHNDHQSSIDNNDSKLNQEAEIKLQKLPESFVETYFKYQDLSEQTEDDSEVDKLVNLQSLHRVQSKENGHSKMKDSQNGTPEQSKTKSFETENLLLTDIKAETCNELSPSEDEDENVEDIAPPMEPLRTENCLAKDFLMNEDAESDSEKLNIDGEKAEKPAEKNENTKVKPIKRLGRPRKPKLEEVKPQKDSLILTADKMMTKELALLHAPVDLKEEIPEIKGVPNKPCTRQSCKTSPKTQQITKELKEKDDDSSSEEEKQWFTTKEKLLKRLGKKQECPSVDDAKRAKLVSEFIEKRSEQGPQIRLRARPQRRRSLKKLMERRKQMKILTRELLGDESSHTGKKSSQTFGKGRRNIRKVINKKALSTSTVVANMEEFERKRRLSVRQAQLREILECEEGVNVVVIDDELCLEYDFEERRPVVTVHPFFTKVMKAHQYEGVKFMWDACFESVSQVRGGHAGSGCILAHCMGLGKTLQVLALLHTVLTHPQVGMQRVLVCCPLSTVLNWVDEIHKWIGPVTGQIKVFELSKLKKTYERAYQLEDWYSGGGIFIIGYELFRSLSTLDPVIDGVRVTIINKIRTALLDPGPDIIICDEGHLLKNDCSVLAVSMSRVQTKRRIVLTGTPMQNNLREYYCMVNFVKPHLLGSYSEYSNRFENPIMNGQHRDSIEEDIKLMKARTHILHKVLEGCLQRQEASVLYPYLPKKHEYTVFVPLTKSQNELYTHYLRNYAKKTKQSVLKDFHVLQKIWTHPQVLHNFFMKTRDEEQEQKLKVEKEDDLVAEDLGASEDKKPSTMETWWLPYVAESEVIDALHSSNKFLVVFRLLEECIALGDKVLIFSTSLYTMDALEYFLRNINKWSLGSEYYRLDGSVPAEVRQKWCREFNAETNTGTKLFLISTRAGSLGLNMTAANRVVILDTSWNPAHDIQSIFRVYRFGQKKDCYIYRLVAMGTMEQKIYERSVTKQAVACRVVDEQQIDRHYNMSELTELYRLDEDGSGVSAGLAAGIRDAALLRVASSDTASGPLLYAVHEHDLLLRGSGETGLAEDERAAVWSQFQEEHATKHIQSIALKLPKKVIDSKLTSNTENTSQNTNNQCAPGASDTKPKSKRGRKSLAKKDVQAQPSTSSHEEPYPNLDVEEAMIKKIMEILIRHNFHSTKTAQEISALIKNVRKAIANPRKNRNIDPVTASIAKVLIEEGVTGKSVAAASDINTEQQMLLEPADTAETIVGTPVDYNTLYLNQESSESEYSGRKRRKQPSEANMDPNHDPDYGEGESTETIVGTPVDDGIYYVDNNESQESIENQHLERKRRRQRRESDEEYVPDKQKMRNQTQTAQNPKPKTRKFTSSSLVANNDETITSDLPSETTQDTEEHILQTTNKIDDMISKIEKQTKIKKKTVEAEVQHDKEITKQQGTFGQQSIDVDKVPANESESILLSDDEEIENPPAKVPDVIPPVNINQKKQTQQAGTAKQADEPPIALHKSLLTNKNFIKIVAHTYLTGNPLMDEDGAVLAAQYSTLKALKELEATNKEITSGPIYDIAVQVLGRELLKKLHNATSITREEGTASTNLQNETVNVISHLKKSVTKKLPQNEIKKKPGPKGKTMGVKKEKAEPIKAKPITPIDVDDPNPSTSVNIQARRIPDPQSFPTSEVVPVEMFQGPPELRSRFQDCTSEDECILPDDDDVIVSHSPTIIGPGHTQLNNRGSSPILLDPVIERQSDAKPKVVQIVKKQPVINPIPLPPPPTISDRTMLQRSSEQSLQKSYSETICIDSDEEEAPLRPIKVVRKAVKSTTKLPNSSVAATITDTPKVSHVATAVTSQSRLNSILEKKKKYILVPATEFLNLESSKNPDSRTQTFLQRVSTQKISAAPVELATAKKVPEQNVPLTQSKTKCTSVDFVRINKTGRMEILRKTSNSSKIVNIASTSKIEATSVQEEFIIADDMPPRKTETPLVININKDGKPTYVQAKSDSAVKTLNMADKTDARPRTPDPLSVLKNVVHIPADKYQNEMPLIEANSGKNTATTNKSYRIAIGENNRGDISSLLKPAPDFMATKESTRATTVKNVIGNEPIKSSVTKMVGTNLKPVVPALAKKGVNSIKMSGTSKDILISKAGALISNARNSPSTSFASSINQHSNMKKPTSQKPAASEVSKRPSPWQDNVPCKKKKPDSHRLTLADFNLDDLDDIIELE